MKNCILLFTLMLHLPSFNCSDLNFDEIAITVLSQSNEYHATLAENLKQDILKQGDILNQTNPVVHLSHIDFKHFGDWTIFPLITILYNLYKDTKIKWFLFVNDRTEIKLENLRKTLAKFDFTQEIWLGHSVHDREATIIHHFAFYEKPQMFGYPNLASGIAISKELFKTLQKRLLTESPTNSEFGIDSAHELGLFIWKKGEGVILQHEPNFCIESHLDCATFRKPFEKCATESSISTLYFAIKTCKKYHSDRVPIVKKTWANEISKFGFFSDELDAKIPTILVNVTNTDQGHCEKTMQILHYVGEILNEDKSIKWVVVADDDTIIGVKKLQQLLSCYNSSNLIALGERYGYKAQNARGYNYITGGGGMVFSKSLVQKLIQNGVCECPTINTPDDMFLGMCISNLGVSITHSSLFHQARPEDYPPEYLETDSTVSFHKHWMIDPVEVYNKWFGEEDYNHLKVEL